MGGMGRVLGTFYWHELIWEQVGKNRFNLKSYPFHKAFHGVIAMEWVVEWVELALGIRRFDADDEFNFDCQDSWFAVTESSKPHIVLAAVGRALQDTKRNGLRDV